MLMGRNYRSLIIPLRESDSAASIAAMNLIDHAATTPFREIQLITIDGTPTTIDAYRDQVLLIVNTASQCGFTPQYAGLDALYRQYHERGLTVLGFPCNQFGAQEPADDKSVAAFCESQYQVSFPMFAKVDVNGPAAHPLFVLLKESARGVLGTTSIKWNFTKFLVSRDRASIRRFAPWTRPERLQRAIRNALAA